MLPLHSKKGFTLTETILSIILFTLVWLTAAEVIVISRVSGSIMKHKTQAIYVAQRALEEAHRKAFSSIINSSSAVSIDTKGTPDNYADDLMGTQTITVTNPSAYYKKVTVNVSWNERLLVTTKSMSEYCATFITNDPQSN